MSNTGIHTEVNLRNDSIVIRLAVCRLQTTSRGTLGNCCTGQQEKFKAAPDTQCCNLDKALKEILRAEQQSVL